jgi:hypothetical protein
MSGRSKPGDSVPAKIEEGLEQSRRLSGSLHVGQCVRVGTLGRKLEAGSVSGFRIL